MDIGRESSCQSHPVLQVFWTPSTPANPDFSDPKTYCQNDMNSFFMDNMWNGIPTIPCSDLLALADAAITTTKVSSGIGGGDNQSNMQLVNQNSQSLSPDGTKYLFDLNSPPLPTEPETITTSSPQLTPKTPKQTTITDLEQPELINEEMEDDVWELEVNQDFEEESNDEITLKKTPQPKQKRRKHRPKVVIEGRPKSAKKAMNSSMKKRKYVRKITPEKTTSAANDPIRQTRNSCRRKINFEEEQESFGQVTEKKTHVDVTIPITPNKSETPGKGTKHTWSRRKRNLNFSQGQNGPNCNTNACFSEGRGSKRQFSGNNGSIPGLHFPTIFKKKRTEKCRRSVTPRAVSSFWFPDSFRVLRIKARERSMTYGVKNQKPYKRMWELGHVGSFRKKRSKGVKRMRDLASLTWPEHRGFTCMEALAADLNVNIATKKRTKRNSLVPYHNHWLLTNHIGFGWKTAYDVHALINQFEDLDINNERVEQNRHALVPYLTRYREKNAIVLYKQNRSLVPFEESYNPLKRRKPRPKVDLDEETSRVWRLLLEDINSEGIDGTNEDKTKWWEEERNVFRGRAVSFIARMHLVQGDRRFSRWKGSVVDSVTGVFLTQNVSDHLSSSAFMSLASRYPLKSNNNHEPLHKEPSQFNLEETITCHEHNPHKKLAQDLSSMTLQNTDSCEESNEYIDSNSFEVISCDHSESELSGISTESASKEPSKQDIFSENLKIIINQQTHENNLDVQNFSEVISSKIDSNEDGNLEKRVSRIKVKKGKMGKGKRKKVDWDSLRVRAQENCKRERTLDAMDSLDYEAVRCADVNEIADVIKDRGMNNMLAERIKEFLNRLVKDHGSIDLEWLRDVPPDKAKEYLLSFRGLGLKSVECVRLLTLHHLAFPVDTNVGRIAVRLGWVPLQPLPESLQLHLLELYPVLESIQKYLWPRLCKLDQRTLYELHYQMITFGKVFCTKNKPNCNACPLRGECRHFASAFASARLSLPSPEEKSIVTTTENETPTGNTNHHHLTLLEHHHTPPESELKNEDPIIEQPPSPEPIVEVPATPEPEHMQEFDLEDFGVEEEEIPTIRLNMEAFTQNLQTYMENNTELAEGDVSKALVAFTSEAASIPTPKLKNVSQLRTEHQVYELPDSHPLLEGLDRREPDDPCSYLLAIWTPGETSESIQPPEGQCSSQESGTLCHKKTCFLCNSIREANTQTVRGTLLIPCRTAMRGSFPLNGTYFQVNEVFADHESSLNPIDVPRSWLWNLPRRTVYFGTSIPTIFRGLTTQGIQYCFWRGFVCVRGFDQKTRAPRPLMARLHFPVSKLKRSRGKFDEND